MKNRDNLIKIFKGQKPEHPLWFADLSWWYYAETIQNKVPDKFMGDGIIDLYKELGCGIYLPLVNAYKLKIDCKQNLKKEGDLQINTFYTPHGEIREVIRELKETFTISYEERLLKTSDDIKAVQYFYDSIQYEPYYDEIKRLDNLYGDHGITLACLPRTPLPRLVVECAGIEATTYAAFETPTEFNKLIEIMQKKDDEVYKIVCNSPAKFAMFPDNLSSETISPRLFSQFSLDYYISRNQQLHTADIFTMVHIDGTLKGLLPILAKSGLDCVEGLTPYPVGDAKPDELRGLTNDKMILWGGLPSPIFTKNWKLESFQLYLFSYLESMKSNYRFVLGVGDQVPPNSDMERVKMVSDIIKSLI